MGLEASAAHPVYRHDYLPLIPAADSRSPPTNLFIDSETPTSLQVRWNPPDGRIQHYKITYNPVSDAGAQQTVSLQLLCR